jgi:hypothetical protein
MLVTPPRKLINAEGNTDETRGLKFDYLSYAPYIHYSQSEHRSVEVQNQASHAEYRRLNSLSRDSTS